MQALFVRMLRLAAAVAALAVAMPASAQPPCPGGGQPSTTGVCPKFNNGDQSEAGIALDCGISTVRGFVKVNNPPAGPVTFNNGNFHVQVTVNQSTGIVSFTDKSLNNTSTADDFFGTPGLEAVGVRKNGTNDYCFPTRISDGGLDPPGNGTPNEITFIWGPGPCPLDATDKGTACDAYNIPTRQADYLQAKDIQAPAANSCGCPPVVAEDCDPALPAGTASSCNPTGGMLLGAPATGSDTQFSGSDCSIACFNVQSGGSLTTSQKKSSCYVNCCKISTQC